VCIAAVLITFLKNQMAKRNRKHAIGLIWNVSAIVGDYR